ncbi:hypothetical protein SNEBB_006150 [Seison nebaliae]|nr:hypothetical protein SNEBB_006150 [Seison nebaliae]
MNYLYISFFLIFNTISAKNRAIKYYASPGKPDEFTTSKQIYIEATGNVKLKRFSKASLNCKLFYQDRERNFDDIISVKDNGIIKMKCTEAGKVSVIVSRILSYGNTQSEYIVFSLLESPYCFFWSVVFDGQDTIEKSYSWKLWLIGPENATTAEVKGRAATPSTASKILNRLWYASGGQLTVYVDYFSPKTVVNNDHKKSFKSGEVKLAYFFNVDLGYWALRLSTKVPFQMIEIQIGRKDSNRMYVDDVSSEEQYQPMLYGCFVQSFSWMFVDSTLYQLNDLLSNQCDEYCRGSLFRPNYMRSVIIEKPIRVKFMESPCLVALSNVLYEQHSKSSRLRVEPMVSNWNEGISGVAILSDFYVMKIRNFLVLMMFNERKHNIVRIFSDPIDGFTVKSMCNRNYDRKNEFIGWNKTHVIFHFSGTMTLVRDYWTILKRERSTKKIAQLLIIDVSYTISEDVIAITLLDALRHTFIVRYDYVRNRLRYQGPPHYLTSSDLDILMTEQTYFTSSSEMTFFKFNRYAIAYFDMHNRELPLKRIFFLSYRMIIDESMSKPTKINSSLEFGEHLHFIRFATSGDLVIFTKHNVTNFQRAYYLHLTSQVAIEIPSIFRRNNYTDIKFDMYNDISAYYYENGKFVVETIPTNLDLMQTVTQFFMFFYSGSVEHDEGSLLVNKLMAPYYELMEHDHSCPYIAFDVNNTHTSYLININEELYLKASVIYKRKYLGELEVTFDYEPDLMEITTTKKHHMHGDLTVLETIIVVRPIINRNVISNKDELEYLNILRAVTSEAFITVRPTRSSLYCEIKNINFIKVGVGCSGEFRLQMDPTFVYVCDDEDDGEAEEEDEEEVEEEDVSIFVERQESELLDTKRLSRAQKSKLEQIIESLDLCRTEYEMKYDEDGGEDKSYTSHHLSSTNMTLSNYKYATDFRQCVLSKAIPKVHYRKITSYKTKRSIRQNEPSSILSKIYGQYTALRGPSNKMIKKNLERYNRGKPPERKRSFMQQRRHEVKRLRKEHLNEKFTHNLRKREISLRNDDSVDSGCPKFTSYEIPKRAITEFKENLMKPSFFEPKLKLEYDFDNLGCPYDIDYRHNFRPRFRVEKRTDIDISSSEWIHSHLNCMLNLLDNDLGKNTMIFNIDEHLNQINEIYNSFVKYDILLVELNGRKDYYFDRTFINIADGRTADIAEENHVYDISYFCKNFMKIRIPTCNLEDISLKTGIKRYLEIGQMCSCKNITKENGVQYCVDDDYNLNKIQLKGDDVFELEYPVINSTFNYITFPRLYEGGIYVFEAIVLNKLSSTCLYKTVFSVRVNGYEKHISELFTALFVFASIVLTTICYCASYIYFNKTIYKKRDPNANM